MGAPFTVIPQEYIEWYGHRAHDVWLQEVNLLSGKPICGRCDGTGNEFFSMYRRCTDCFGTGIEGADV